MRIEEAVEASSVQAAYRPYYIGDTDGDVMKFIVCRGLIDYYLVTPGFVFIRELEEHEAGKIIGRSDWEPVAPTSIAEGLPEAPE